MRFRFLFVFIICHSPLLAQDDGLTPSADSIYISLPDSIISNLEGLTINIPLRDTVSIIGVGDIMMGTNYPEEKAALPIENGRYLLQEVADILRSADVTFGNLEGVLIDSGGVAKTCRNPDVCYVFRSPESYVQNLADAGFDVISLANNHSGDFGDEGRERTAYTLAMAGIEYAGHLTKPYTLFEKNGVRYGFTALAPNTGCVDINDLVTARSIVTHLDSLSDIVIVSFHGGAEGAAYQHVPRKHEIFVGEDRGDVYSLAHTLIDAGADVIFGHGPHVTRGVEVYKERFIAYSLGNFCTYSGINVSGVNGLAPLIDVQTTREGTFLSARITPIRQVSRTPVMIDPQKEVIKVMQALTLEDFPESVITISPDGTVNYSTN